MIRSKAKISSGKIQDRHAAADGVPMYYQPEYISAVAPCDTGSVPMFFEYDGTEGRCYYQFLLRPITIKNFEQYQDIVTPFDYGGFYYSDKSVLPVFFEEFVHFCKEMNIVSEFIRFCPVYSLNYEIIEKHITTAHIADHYYVDLTSDYRLAFSKSRDRNINRALSLDCFFSPSDTATFCGLYKQTMDRIGANPYFYFPEQVLNSLVDNGFAEIHSIGIGGRAYCSAVTLTDGDTAYYFLGGSLDTPEKNDLNSLLFVRLFEKYQKEGVKTFFLGGGNRGVAEFKRRFTDKTVPYYIGRKIHDKEVYNELSELNKNKDNSFFPAYREKII